MFGNRNAEVNRRDVIKATAAIIGGFIAVGIGLPAIAYLLAPALRETAGDAWITLGKLDDYPLNIPTLVQFTRTKVNGWERTAVSYGIFVVRTDRTNVRVFSNICTHLGCHVNWHPDIQHYVSPCHDGHFDIMGKNISGPPPRPLDEYRTRIEDGILHAMLPPYRRSA